MFYNKTPVFF